MVSSGGSSVLMTCAALGLLLRVSYELDRARRQVALRRSEVPGAMPHDAPASVAPARTEPPAPAAPERERGRARIEPVLGAPVAVPAVAHALRRRT
jgi:cell division protein FtsW